MRRLVLLTMAILMVSSLAFGQTIIGSLDVFSDPGYTSCMFTDAVAGLFPIYVVHTGTNGATATQFKVTLTLADAATPLAALTYIGESSPYPTVIGNSRTDISVAYGACLSSPILVLTINYFGAGASPACALINVLPANGAPTGLVEFVNCASTKFTLPHGGQGRINSDGSCDCTVPTQESSWGKIKALYN